MAVSPLPKTDEFPTTPQPAPRRLAAVDAQAHDAAQVERAAQGAVEAQDVVSARGAEVGGMFEAVTRPRLWSVRGTGEHYVPPTARYAGELTEGALALRLHAITRLGVASAPEASTTAPAPVARQAAGQPDAVPGRTDGAQAPLKSIPKSTPAARNKSTATKTSVRTKSTSASGAGVVVGRRGVGEAPALPEVRAWGARLAQAVSEVLAGDRPISQLVRFTDEQVFQDLNRRVRLLGLNSTAGTRGAKEKSAVRSVRVFMPEPFIAEVAAHVRHGERSRAVAFRLEVRRNRWVCTALELG
ncbi:Rv3235 family protein [Kribbella sp. NPDC048928]|uniref:Rv3235 family protein n=1 Tax=Kribbella sp. NPDC048928 TaxID=3364111 RepID=UPI0037186459